MGLSSSCLNVITRIIVNFDIDPQFLLLVLVRVRVFVRARTCVCGGKVRARVVRQSFLKRVVPMNITRATCVCAASLCIVH